MYYNRFYEENQGVLTTHNLILCAILKYLMHSRRKYVHGIHCLMLIRITKGASKMSDIKNVKKSKGRVYTPDYIVNNILDMAHYVDENIIEKHVIDNSCGDGAFLCTIVSRYCDIALKKGMSPDCLKTHLEQYIHGIEIEPAEHKKCLENVSKIAAEYGITTDISWDIICANTLTEDKYNGKMDFVLGNPPYVRVHNLDESFDIAKKFSFAQDGMTDLYIVFYEIGLKMLNNNGILGYITPSSFFNSLAGNYIRKMMCYYYM